MKTNDAVGFFSALNHRPQRSHSIQPLEIQNAYASWISLNNFIIIKHDILKRFD